MDEMSRSRTEPIIETPAYQIMPDRLTLLETELQRLRDKQKWYVILWFILFLLLLGETGFLLYLHETGLKDLRSDTGTQSDQLSRRVDDTRTRGEDQLQKQTQPLNDRLNQLSDQISALRIEAGVTQSRLDNLSLPAPVIPLDK